MDALRSSLAASEFGVLYIYIYIERERYRERENDNNSNRDSNSSSDSNTNHEQLGGLLTDADDLPPNYYIN